MTIFDLIARAKAHKETAGRFHGAAGLPCDECGDIADELAKIGTPPASASSPCDVADFEIGAASIGWSNAYGQRLGAWRLDDAYLDTEDFEAVIAWGVAKIVEVKARP